MIIGIKDLSKLFAVTVVSCCAVFVCALFLNYNIDIVHIKDEISSPQAMIVYEAQTASGKVVAGVSGGCLAATTAVLLIFYVKNHIDSHGKELGILKALGYTRLRLAKQFMMFGISVFSGAVLGYSLASCYMPAFYRVQNAEGMLPPLSPGFHPWLAALLILLPTVFFSCLSGFYAAYKLKLPVLCLIRGIRKVRKVRARDEAEIYDTVKTRNSDALQSISVKTDSEEPPFPAILRRNTLKSRKILVFFVCFSAFCFSSMTQMSLSMRDLSSESFSWMILLIGLILAFMTLFMSLTGVINANKKSIAMMRAFGYSETECSASVLGGYRPVSYIGFAAGTLYQYFLLKIMVNIVFADYETMPEFSFNFKVMAISLVLFIAVYETVMRRFAGKACRQSVKEIMSD